MITKGIKKYLINPSLGLITGILYIILFWTTNNVLYSLSISIVFSILIDIALRLYTKASVCGLIFLFNSIALGITLIVKLLSDLQDFPPVFYLVLYFVTFTTILFISRLSKTYISLYLGKKKSIVQKTFLSEIFEIARLTQYTITLYLFAILIFSFLKPQKYLWEASLTIYCIIPIAILVTIIIYEEVKTRSIIKQLRKEEWLPIVNESGEVTGRIARSVSSKMKNRFMHPVVRVALIHNGEIYLQKRSDSAPLDPGTYDHPFEKYMLFNHEINIAVRNSISRLLNMQELPFNFLIKYVFENENTKRLIFLFVARIETESQLKSISLLNGKFWTTKQIEESFADDKIFSECFQLEYEYLKNVVIQAELAKKETVKQ
ncbi:NUDIX hydrolase [Dysgonomonas macrotermitis]|uniref:Nudix hydrolase domain-containing protein n=1 Tax=Dysgonomonas macrotermitis TaxID=1346286 RepID=A0A1M5EFS5_9BACT|nr:hypothetical protein [Dysgonomonas macrotermitis]SHF77912.1 hypothetical protein SAMN05444362_11018 [Dysgonomonas macrotermitis]